MRRLFLVSPLLPLTAAALVACGGTATAPDARDCAQPVTFGDFLVDPSVLKVVTPIGIVGGGGTELVGRSYVFPRDDLAGVRLALTAPSSARVIAATHYAPDGAPSGYRPDWSLVLAAGCGVNIELYHVKDVSDAIKSAADTAVGTSSAWKLLGSPVLVRSGETFGWYVKGLNSIAFDFIVRRDDVMNHFANQARYVTAGSNLLHVVCPWDLFVPGKREAYLALLGSVGGFPVPGATCGTVERDVPGTVAGQWFLTSTLSASFRNVREGDYGDPLPIVRGPDSVVVIGHMGPGADLRIYPGNSSWKDPASVNDTWCYQLQPSGWLWLRVNTLTQMDVAYGATGACPPTFPASGYRAYYR